MKKIFVVIALMIFSSQAFAQEETQKRKELPKEMSTETIENIKKGWNGKMPTLENCPDWLDCKTGQVKYYDIPANYIIDNPNWCEPFGVKIMLIKKGIYEIDWKVQRNGGVVILMLESPQDAPKLKAATVAGTRPISLSCHFYGHRCASASVATSEADNLNLSLSPVIENGKWVALKLMYNNGNPTLPLVLNK